MLSGISRVWSPFFAHSVEHITNAILSVSYENNFAIFPFLSVGVKYSSAFQGLTGNRVSEVDWAGYVADWMSHAKGQ